MTKDTVRYPDPVVDEIDALVDDGVFESKSEFYRFAAEYVLSVVAPDYDVQTFNFEELRAELAVEPAGRDVDPEASARFLGATTTVRKHCHRGEFAEAARFIDATYAEGDPEALLLEEILGLFRRSF